MKNRIWIAVIAVLLSAAVLLLLPPAHPADPEPTEPSTPPTLQKPTRPPAPGAVRLYCCNGQWLTALQELAGEYKALTGTEVTILTPDPDGCQATLARHMVSEDPPTVLCVHTQEQLVRWQEVLLDLSDTELAAKLYSQAFGLCLEGKMLAVPVDVEAFGLLFNAELLATKAAQSRNDIVDMTTLATTAQILKNNSFTAFPSAQWDPADAAWLLSVGEVSDIRGFLELYLTYCAPSGDPLEQFLGGEAVFYLGGTWDFDMLMAEDQRSMEVRNLDILPTFSAGAMQYVSNMAWCVNGSVRQVDIDATMDFLNWMTTATEAATAPIDRLQTLAPFADATWYANQLEKRLRVYMRQEPATVAMDTVDVAPKVLLMALDAYLADPGEQTWNGLQLLLEQGLEKTPGYRN